MALEVFEQVDDVIGILGRGRRVFGGGLQQKGLADVGVEQVFCSGEASCVLYGVGEAGNVEDDGVGSFFGAQALASFKAAFAEGAREAENSGDGLNVFLLLVGES